MFCSCCRFQKYHKCGGMISNQPIKVAVTGAAGRVSYSLLFMICKGDVFGIDQPIILHLIETPGTLGVLSGIVMELLDCNFPLVKKIIATSKLEIGFKDISAAFLVGGKARTGNMTRADLLAANAAVFKSQGEALNEYAHKDVKVLVIANPVNTNALICSKNAPSIPIENFTSLSRLDQNRARAQIAARIGVSPNGVFNVLVWGNHSNTQVPDASHAKIELNGKMTSVEAALQDDLWLQTDFLELVRKRAERVLTANSVTSALSAANAACEHMNKWFMSTEPGEYVSFGVYSDGSYGIPNDIFFSFPVAIRNGVWYIVQGLDVTERFRDMLLISAEELISERELALSFFKQGDETCKEICGIEDCKKLES